MSDPRITVPLSTPNETWIGSYGRYVETKSVIIIYQIESISLSIE